MRKITTIKTIVFTCGHCKAWYCRIPAWDDLGKGDQCERCGATCFASRSGRPVGPRSRHWPWMLDEALDLLKYNSFALFGGPEQYMTFTETTTTTGGTA